jgi:hypothetical protein
MEAAPAPHAAKANAISRTRTTAVIPAIVRWRAVRDGMLGFTVVPSLWS